NAALASRRSRAPTRSPTSTRGFGCRLRRLKRCGAVRKDRDDGLSADLPLLALGSLVVGLLAAASPPPPTPSANTESKCLEIEGGSFLCSSFHTGKSEPERVCEFQEPGAAEEIIYLETADRVQCRRARAMLSHLTPEVRAPERVGGPGGTWT